MVYFLSKIRKISQLRTRFTPHSDQLGIKTGGVLKIAGHFLQLLSFALKLSDLLFRSYKALHFSKKHYIFFVFVPLHLSSKTSDAGENSLQQMLHSKNSHIFLQLKVFTSIAGLGTKMKRKKERKKEEKNVMLFWKV